jgi:hypothetical protein
MVGSWPVEPERWAIWQLWPEQEAVIDFVFPISPASWMRHASSAA